MTNMERPDPQQPEEDLRPRDQRLYEVSLGGRDGFDAGFHSENLFDQNEDREGNTHDPATGNPIDNATHREEDDVLRIGHVESEPPPLDDEDDEAARWLREHGEAA